MLLSQVYKQLSRSTLQALQVGDLGKGDIKPEYRPIINDHINKALLQLFALFPLKEKEVVVTLKENVSTYYLRKEYGKISGSDDIPYTSRYIDETPMNLFEGDVLRILTIRNKQGKIQYKNDMPACTDIRVPEFDAIQVPLPRTGEILFVSYSAAHPTIPDDADPEKTHVHIPDSHLEAVCNYVGHLEYSSMTGERQMAKAQDYLNKFTYQCERISHLNLDNEGYAGTNTRFDKRGFV